MPNEHALTWLCYSGQFSKQFYAGACGDVSNFFLHLAFRGAGQIRARQHLSADGEQLVVIRKARQITLPHHQGLFENLMSTTYHRSKREKWQLH